MDVQSVIVNNDVPNVTICQTNSTVQNNKYMTRYGVMDPGSKSLDWREWTATGATGKHTHVNTFDLRPAIACATSTSGVTCRTLELQA